jgi:hypothetical protein
MADKPKRRGERLNRRKVTLLKKASKIAEFCEVILVLILHIAKTDRYITL